MKRVLLLLMMLIAAVALFCLDTAPARADGPVAAFWNWRAAANLDSAARHNAKAAALGAPTMMLGPPTATYSNMPVMSYSYRYAVVPEVTAYSLPAFSSAMVVSDSVMTYSATTGGPVTTPIPRACTQAGPVSMPIPRACTQAGPAPCTPAVPMACTPAR